MARRNIFSRFNGMIGRIHTARILDELSPQQRADIGLDPRARIRYDRPYIHAPTQH